VDPAEHRARAVLEAKRLTPAAPAYADTAIYPNIVAAAQALASSPPSLVILGSPPALRGRCDANQGLNAEELLTDAFPKSALFVEKPVSTATVKEAQGVAQLPQGRKANVVSVGYMLRYSAAAQK